MTAFGTFVQRHFDFLVTEFGFRLAAADAAGASYERGALDVEIGTSKGEFDLTFTVKVDTDVLRPYVSHRFGLDQVVRYYKQGPFPVFASFTAAPDATTDDRWAMYLAGLTRQYCGEILRGDLVPFERLSANPGAKADR